MKTLRLVAKGFGAENPEGQGGVERAAMLLREGGLVAFPTETVYGLGANALDEAAIAGIFEAKGRPGWDPLIVHVCDEEMLRRVIAPLTGELAARVEKLTRAFWPGPLTLLLPKHPAIPAAVTAGRERVGVRMPQHPVALELIRQAGVPIAAPSANRFGHTSPTTAAHVLRDLDGRIDAVLDGGPTQIGVESTVLDVFPEGSPASAEMVVYRPGKVTLAEIEAVAGPVRRHVAEKLSAGPDADQSGLSDAGRADADRSGLPSPGVGLRHYAPRARLVLAEDKEDLAAKVSAFASEGERVGVMLPRGWSAPASAGTILFAWAAMEDKAAQARLLFAGLRELDERGATVILCPLPVAEGLGEAMVDRLRKAAWE
ncbi:MAG: L-threonylcarbamoyladenylate synthase [Acidobacteriaceae bacterium]